MQEENQSRLLLYIQQRQGGGSGLSVHVRLWLVPSGILLLELLGIEPSLYL